MSKPIVNLDELEYSEFGKGDKFHATRAPISTRISANNLGYAIIKLKPGKRAWPYHSHYVIEEMFYIIEGSGTLRHADEKYPIRAGDFISSPADPDQPHQIINTSDQELVYMALSTDEPADIVQYPDSGKYGVWHGDSKNRDAPKNFRVFARKETAVDYWDGESD